MRSFLSLAAAGLFAFSLSVPLRAQDSTSTNEAPPTRKLTFSSHQQAYSGKIQSLDMKRKILNVNSLRGRQSEIFPIKKHVRVESLDGGRMNLSELTPGMTVLIYYDQKAGERTVKNIVVLNSGKGQEKRKRTPSS